MYPPPPETNCKGDRHGMWWACGSITTVSTDLFMFAPMTTYQLLVSPGGLAENIYQVFGDTVNPMMLPPAYQDSAAGANFGGVSPDAVAGSPTAAFDSWLTVGETTGDSGGKLSAFGINFGSWTGTTGLLVPNGYVSLSDQVNAPTSDVVVAQLTAPQEAVSAEQIGALTARLETLHAARLLSDDELFAAEDCVADFLEVKGSVGVVTMDVVHANRAAGKAHKLVVLSEGVAKDAMFARQLRRKFV